MKLIELRRRAIEETSSDDHTVNLQDFAERNGISVEEVKRFIDDDIGSGELKGVYSKKGSTFISEAYAGRRRGEVLREISTKRFVHLNDLTENYQLSVDEIKGIIDSAIAKSEVRGVYTRDGETFYIDEYLRENLKEKIEE